VELLIKMEKCFFIKWRRMAGCRKCLGDVQKKFYVFMLLPVSRKANAKLYAIHQNRVVWIFFKVMYRNNI
jgi:hypothetical protein